MHRSNFFITGVFSLVLLGAAFLAWRNVQQKKGDRQGAFRLAVFMLAAMLIGWLFHAHHVPTEGEIDLLTLAIRDAMYFAGMVWILYLALEPYVRRRWPTRLIAWRRVLMGNWRDPLVGRDLLLGLMAGIYLVVLKKSQDVVSIRQGSIPMGDGLLNLGSLRYATGTLADRVALETVFALGTFFLIFLLCVWLRREWLAAAVVVLIGMIPPLLFGDTWATISLALFGVGLFLVTARLGLLAIATVLFVTENMASSFPLTTNFSAWYVSHSMIGIVLLLAFAGYAFHTSLGGQKVFAGKLLEE